MAHLAVIAGPHQGQARELKQPKSVVGRHPDCDVPVESLEASRHHAQLLFLDNQWFVEDLHSCNGTYLNDKRVHVRCPVRESDRIRVLDTVFEFHLGEPRLAADKNGPIRAAAVPELVDDKEGSSSRVVVSQLRMTRKEPADRPPESLRAELAAVLRITRSLRRTLALEEVVPQILATLFDIFPSADRAFIVLEGEDGELTTRWVRLRQGDDPNAQLPISRTIVRQIMESQQAILSEDVTDDSRFEVTDSLKVAMIHSMMCAPLIDGTERSFGALQIDSVDESARFRDQDLELLTAVAAQASVAMDNARLHEIALQQFAVERDMELADRIQRSFLPAQPPLVPGYQFFHFYQPAYHVGGDFYDYVPLPGGRLAVVVADVAGHGLAAAMLTAKLAAEIRYRLLNAAGPADAVAQLNRSLAPDLEEHFITLLLMELAPHSGETVVVNAGHFPPLLRTGDSGVSEIGIQTGGLPLGIDRNSTYEASTFQIPPSASILLYTDGILDAESPLRQRFGSERLRQRLASAPAGPRQIVGNLVGSVKEHMQGSKQEDDMCLICVVKE